VTSGGRAQIAEVSSGSSYYSQSDLRLHFGLARAAKVELVELAWPSGLREALRDLPVNHAFVVREGEGVVSRRAFR
jgi:enediyne biosynthesis protein E4